MKPNFEAFIMSKIPQHLQQLLIVRLYKYPEMLAKCVEVDNKLPQKQLLHQNFLCKAS